MENKTFTALQVNTGLAQSAQATFYLAGTLTVAPVYGSNVVGTPLTQPISTNSNGQVSVWAPNQVYDIKMVPSVGPTKIISNVTFYDVTDDPIVQSIQSEGGSGGSIVNIYDTATSTTEDAFIKSITPGGNISLSDSSGLITITGRLDVAQTWAAAQDVAIVNLTYGTPIATDASLSNTFQVTLTGDTTLQNPTNLVAGKTIIWHITQGSGAPFTLAYDTYFQFPNGVRPTLSTGVGNVDVISGTVVANGGGFFIRCTFSPNFS